MTVRQKSIGITFLIGLLMHQYVMSNQFFNFFEMGNIMSEMSYCEGDTLALGRWFLPVATNLFTSYSIPSVNGVLLIGYLSLTALLVCDLFRIEKLATRVLTGLAVLSFQGVAVSFSYGVNADAIGLGVLLSVLGVWFYEKYRFGILPGVLCIGLSIGIYQPSVAVGIAVIYGILFLQTAGTETIGKEGHKEAFSGKEFVKEGLKKALFLVLGFVFYYVLLQIVLQVTGTKLSNYHGVDSMTSFTPKGIAKGFVYAYLYFFRYFFLGDYVDHPLRLAGNYAAALLFAGFLIRCLMRLLTEHKKGQSLWLLGMTALLPLGVDGAPFLMADRVGSGVDIYMLYSMMLLWVLFLKLLEVWKTEQDKNGKAESRQTQWGTWCAVGAVVFTIFNGYIICNQVYHRMEAMTVTTTSLLERMTARIEAMPEWESKMPVYFVNPRPLVNENYQTAVPEYDRMENLVGTEIVPWYNERAIARYMNVYLRFPVTLATEEQKNRVDELGAAEAMDSFPAADCMQVIDGVLVVKVSNGEELKP